MPQIKTKSLRQSVDLQVSKKKNLIGHKFIQAQIK